MEAVGCAPVLLIAPFAAQNAIEKAIIEFNTNHEMATLSRVMQDLANALQYPSATEEHIRDVVTGSSKASIRIQPIGLSKKWTA